MKDASTKKNQVFKKDFNGSLNKYKNLLITKF